MKNTISLNGPWRLACFDESGGDWSTPDALLTEGAREIEGHVPGEVHMDLLRAGMIADPHCAANADEVRWVEEKEWWYKRTFEVDEDLVHMRAFLEFDGLDTFATVFLNGEEVGRTANMFIPHRFDVGSLLRVGRNTVAVRFDPAKPGARKMRRALGSDRTPRFVGAGIWRDARLVSYDGVAIADVRIETEIEGGYANVWIAIEVENFTLREQPVSASIVVARGGDREKIEVLEEVPPFGGVIEAAVRIEEPELWWPNGMGAADLYTCMVGLRVEGEVRDVFEQKFGVRSVRFVESDQQGNKALTLLVNGERVFCRGANWAPSECFPSNVTAQRLRELVGLATRANVNMLRVRSGGVYESPEFYEACDELGIMVWQDFMFDRETCPDTEEFAAEAAREVRSVVKRLRNHPSIVVWDGDDEREIGGASAEQDRPGKRLFHEVIPNLLRGLDRMRPYHPYGGHDGENRLDACLGDHTRWRHLIEEERDLFVTGFGMQGPPMVESLRDFIPEDKLYPPDNEVWEYCSKGSSHRQAPVDLARAMIGEFGTAEEFAAYGGILQGEFVKAQIEHYRREKWAISGALLRMLGDCRPAISSSIVDYYLRPKVAYYYAKRAFAPVIVSFKQLEDRVELHVTSDERSRDIDGKLEVGVLTFDTCGMDMQTAPVKLHANSTRAFWESAPLDELLPEPTRQCLVALLTVGGEVAAKNIYFARPFSEMEFPQPKLLIQREQLAEDAFRMTISADAYARNVAIGGLPAGARLSDNYFDLLPGELREVTVEDVGPDDAANMAINVWRR